MRWRGVWSPGVCLGLFTAGSGVARIGGSAIGRFPAERAEAGVEEAPAPLQVLFAGDCVL